MKRKAKVDPLVKAKQKIYALKTKLRIVEQRAAAYYHRICVWHTIDTAPRDGTTILVKGKEGPPSTASFHTEPDGSAGWIAGVANGKVLVIERTLTHWCRVPE